MEKLTVGTITLTIGEFVNDFGYTWDAPIYEEGTEIGKVYRKHDPVLGVPKWYHHSLYYCPERSLKDCLISFLFLSKKITIEQVWEARGG